MKGEKGERKLVLKRIGQRKQRGTKERRKSRREERRRGEVSKKRKDFLK